MKRAAIVWICVCVLAAGLTVVGSAGAQTPSPASVAIGGKLYDKWWKAVPGVKEPVGDHPLWATQNTNKRTGLDTWRCKECHGWDYKGKDGAYGSGSHKTGFPGVMAAQAKSLDQLKAVLKGSTNSKHNFSPALDDTALTNLATFLKHGVIDLASAVDAKAKKPVKADADHGKQLSVICTACHNPDGKKLNFGTPNNPEYVGTIATENPWEFLHKVRVGQAGSEPPMPAGMEMGWNLQDMLDILAYSQTLPVK